MTSDGVRALFLALVLVTFAGCGTSANPVAPTPAPLAAGNINLIFVVSDDLDYQAGGDVDPVTANLTAQGLQRTLLMAPYLQQNVLGNVNVTSIYALEPMTHLQTTSGYPDMAALEMVQQFALFNQFTMYSDLQLDNPSSGNSFPINVSYALGSVPSGVAMPSPLAPCPLCQGIDYNDLDSENETLLAGIVNAKVPGYYVFSAPWEPTHNLLENFNTFEKYHLRVPSSYQDPNHIYAISITPAGNASLATYDSKLTPSNTYPALDPVPALSACKYASFTLGATAASSTLNKNETVYFIRHANAHPTGYFSDGNYVAAGQWRALYLGVAIPRALQGLPQPTHIYSLDPAQVTPNAGYSASGPTSFSHNTLALTAEPYAIASGLPYSLVSSFLLTDSNVAQETSDYYFQGGQFNNQTILVAWEHGNIPLILAALLNGSYTNLSSNTPDNTPALTLPIPTAPATSTTPTTLPAALQWDPNDYDSIWTITLDGSGNLKANNSLCEGIDSKLLPAWAPQF